MQIDVMKTREERKDMGRREGIDIGRMEKELEIVRAERDRLQAAVAAAPQPVASTDPTAGIMALLQKFQSGDLDIAAVVGALTGGGVEKKA